MINSTQAPPRVVGGVPQVPKPNKMSSCTKRPGDPRIDPFGPEGHALCGRGTSRAKWATAGVFFSTFVFFIVPVSLGWPLAPLHLTGSGFGLAMYYMESHGLGFHNAFRQLVSDHKSRVIRAHCVILSLTCCVLPLLLELFPEICFPSSQPVGLAVLVGSFLFGIGMVLSQMDAVGMLLGAGRGSASAWATLAGFVVGSALSAPTGERVAWSDAPSVTGAWTLASKIGPVPAVAVQLGGLSAVFFGGLTLEKIRHSRVEPLLTSSSTASESMSDDREFGLEESDDDSLDSTPRNSVESDLSVAETAGLLNSGERISTHSSGDFQTSSEWHSGEPIRTGPFGLRFIATISVALATANGLSLVIGSHAVNPGIGVRMWGLEVGAIFGEQHPHAQVDQASTGEVTPVLVQASSQNLSFLLVAACVAIFTQTTEWCLQLTTSWQRLLVSVCGGALMGYGASVSWGDCVGGIWSAVASTSIHGWLWFGGALIGSWLAIQLERLCTRFVCPSPTLYANE